MTTGLVAALEDAATLRDAVDPLASANTLSGWRDAQADWSQEAESRLLILARLQADWDREGASAPRLEALRGAATLIRQLVAIDAPPPFLTATQDGGIQFEWSSSTWTVEIEVASEDQHHLCWMNRDNGLTWEGAPDYSPENVDKLLRRISEEHLHGDAA